MPKKPTPKAAAAAAGRKTITSAIEGLSVSDVRRALYMMRQHWRKHSPDNPLRLARPLFPAFSIEEFALRFVLGQHEKRHQKTRRETEAQGSQRVVTMFRQQSGRPPAPG